MPLVKIKEKFQITLPAELREVLHLAVGDLLEATIQDNVIVLKPKIVVDREQALGGEIGAVALTDPRHHSSRAAAIAARSAACVSNACASSPYFWRGPAPVAGDCPGSGPAR